MMSNLGKFLYEHPKLTRSIMVTLTVIFGACVYGSGYETGRYDLVKELTKEVTKEST